MTGSGLEQEQALQIVAMHDAGALVEALLPGLAAARATTALLNWRTHCSTGEPRTQRQINWAHQERTQWVSLNQLPTHDGFLPGAYKPLWKAHPLDRLQEVWAMIGAKEAEYGTTDPIVIQKVLQKQHGHYTTLEADTTRAGDDCAD